MTALDTGRWAAEIAGRLGRLRQAPAAVLATLVRRDGACMRPLTGAEPAWRDAHLTDRDLAAELCRGCPVQDPCLELELRTAGPDTVGVWGGLPDDDRRDLHRLWLRHRTRTPLHTRRGNEEPEGGRQQ